MRAPSAIAHRCLDVTALRVVGISRRRGAAYDLLAITRENGDAVP